MGGGGRGIAHIVEKIHRDRTRSVWQPLGHDNVAWLGMVEVETGLRGNWDQGGSSTGQIQPDALFLLGSPDLRATTRLSI
jgi:hypothetical protein